MATLTSSKVGTGTAAKGLSVGLVAVTAVYSVNASLSAGDVIQMVNVPKGATVVYAALGGIGTNQEAIIALGDGVDTDRYLAHATMSASSAAPRVLQYEAAVAPYTYSTDDTIDIVVSTVSLDTIGGGFHLTVIFSKDTV
jgi:hypothetical protein